MEMNKIPFLQRIHKAVLLTLFLALCSCPTLVAQSLVVWQKDGTCVCYALDERPKTTFTDDCLVITTRKLSVDYPLDAVARYTYDLADDIDLLPSDRGLVIKQTNSSIMVQHLSPGATLSLYAPDGKLLASTQSTGRPTTSLLITHLSAGTYLVKAGNTTYKFLKR